MPKAPDPCAEVLARLDDYLDGELTAEEAGRVEAHAAACAACAAELELGRRVLAGLRSLPQLDAPPALLARLRDNRPILAFPSRPAPAPRPVPRPVRRISRRAALAALAAVLTLVAAGTTLRLALKPPTVPPPTPQQVALATDQARFALAYIGRVSRRAGLELRDEVLAEHLAAPAARTLSRSLDDTHGPAAGLPAKKGS